MSTWYKAGTASFANGSATVTGSGTSWVDNVKIGDALRAPDGRVYEIVEIVSSSELEIRPAYEGSSESNADYAIQPTRGILQRVFNQIQAWLDAAAGFGTAATEDDDRYVNVTDAQTIAGVKNFSDGVEADSYGGDGVTQSETDTTPGRLLKTGDFGYGVEQQVSGGSADDLTTPGKYNFSSGDSPSGLPNFGAGGTIEVFYDRFGFVRQHYYVRDSTRFYVRASDSSTVFGDWSEVYHTGNILGTVSQSGGTPTGAVIESGSNSNGEYVRYADGTQICWQQLDMGTRTRFGSGSSSDPYRSDTSDWTFPSSFSGEPNITATHSIDTTNASARHGGAMYRSVSPTSVNTFQVGFISDESDNDAVFLDVRAIGRWF